MPYWLRGGKDGYGLPEHLRDKDGDLMHTGRFYDMQKKAHTDGKGPGFRAYSANPIDWDGDGDLDLLVGTDHGGIYLRVNEGSKTDIAFATEVVELKDAHGNRLEVPGGYQMPVLADWDGDGLRDLISGSQDGQIYWFRNVGKAAERKFAPATMLVETKRHGIGGRTQVCVADYDADGKLDLLVGDNHQGMDGDKIAFHGYVWFFRRN